MSKVLQAMARIMVDSAKRHILSGRATVTRKPSALPQRDDWCSLLRKSIAEFLGVMTLVYLGSMSFSMPATIGALGPAVTHGFTITTCAVTFAHISGALFNPAVTFAVCLSRAVHPLTGFMFVLAQVLGASFGALLLYVSMNADMYCKISGGTTNMDYSVLDLSNAVFMEAMFGFILTTTVLNTAVDSKGTNTNSALAIGLVHVINICAGGDKSGASMNPARSLGPAIIYSMLRPLAAQRATDASTCITIEAVWMDEWIYWLGPFIGATIAAALYILYLASDNSQRLFLKDANSNGNKVLPGDVVPEIDEVDLYTVI